MSTGVKTVMNDQADQQSQAEPSAQERPSERGQRDRGRRRQRQARHLEASINMNELRELIGLITDNGLTDFELEREGFHVKIGRGTSVEDTAPSAVPRANEKQAAAGSGAPAGSVVQSVPATAAHPGAQA